MQISFPLFGTFRLDGGAMFGSVPKNIWAQRITCDDENCIPLATRSMLIRTKDRCVLVDVGLGEKWPEKLRKIYGIRNTPQSELGFAAEDVTDVLLTHLHFDHAGGITRYDDGDPAKLTLSYPHATIHLQRANFEHAQHPTLKDRASYLQENVQPLTNAAVNLLDGDCEVFPGIFVHRSDGHTPGQQWVEVRDGQEIYIFPTDIVPTSRHVPLAFHMGYDVCAQTILADKEKLLSYAVEKNALVVFQHDADVPAGRIGKDERGQYMLRDASRFP